MNDNYQLMLNDLESQIKNNQRFNSKEELNNYIIYLKNNFIPQDVLTNEKVLELLQLYDSVHQNDVAELDMQNYKAASLENQNVIISQKDDVVLKTNNSNEELPKEFKDIQNEITASSPDGLANADVVFEHMKENKKEVLNLLSFDEALQQNNIDTEFLNKIKFFVSNQYINPYSFKIDIENEIFYNMEDHSVLEVRKNEQTGKYEIYKGGEIIYGENTISNEYSDEQLDNSQEVIKDTDEEQLAYKNAKVRRLVKPNNLNNAAFAKSIFLFTIICFASIILAILLISINN